MQSNTIFINPKFKAHINPNFLKLQNGIAIQPTQIKIHINPNFLKEKNESIPLNGISRPPDPVPIVNTRRKLIRASTTQNTAATRIPNEIIELTKQTNRLFALTRNKLVRYQPQKVKVIPHQKTISRPLKSKYKIKNLLKSTFKIDRRASKFNPFSSISKNPISQRKVEPHFKSNHKKLIRININGVLYNATKNKLQRSPSKSSESSRVLFVKGEKFQLDASGLRLDNVTNTFNGVSRQRIDIGGLTYIKSSTTNTFERTNTHITRNHLKSTKQRCITLLSRKLVKNNLPCAIYRRLGKCLSFNRGRCPKVHDPNQVSICQRFLKGDCQDQKCLLSHKVSLSKMPTCKFFLKGICVNSNCSYLHKKVSQETKICENFVKGYCPLAEKCSKRHEFVCMDFEATGVCSKKNCASLHKPPWKSPMKSTELIAKKKEVPSTSDDLSADTCLNQRYYTEISEERREHILAKVERVKEKYVGGSPNETSVELAVPLPTTESRSKLGPLPSYIPI